MYGHKKIYNAILSCVNKKRLSRDSLVDSVASELSGIPISALGEVGRGTEISAEVGSVVDEMLDGGVLSVEGDVVVCCSSRYVALRAERLEKEILSLLDKRPRTKSEIRQHLEATLGTSKTATLKDDETLFSMNGNALTRLIRAGLIVLNKGKYSIAPEKRAKLDDIGDMLSLKSDFLTRIHSKGGEFFEHYIMTLLGKYLDSFGITVSENRVNGGSADGGIDGIMKTVNPLGFRENIMVQAKNRLELSTETVVRGFFGAVCASGGSRGIFATTSDFHPSAKAFLDGLDNCVGVNGDKIFEMAIRCKYGLKKINGKYTIDTRII